MYFDVAPSCSPLMDDAADTNADDLIKQRLSAYVREACPDLAGSLFRLEQGGGDHLLLIADERRAFRFPRPGRHSLELERAILRSLGKQAQVGVPDYDLVDPAGRFASYRLVSGVPLTPERFCALSTETAQGVISTAVTLLRSLHALEPGAFRPVDTWPRMWSPIQFAERLQTERLPVLAIHVPTLADPIAEFLQRYRVDQATHEVVLHGDLVGDHLLVDEKSGRLAGIIDFGDVALGDPAQDFLGFWAYGARAAADAVAAYGQFDSDPTLLARSRNHFIRYQIDRLFEAIADDVDVGEIQRRSASLAVLLSQP